MASIRGQYASPIVFHAIAGALSCHHDVSKAHIFILACALCFIFSHTLIVQILNLRYYATYPFGI